MSDTGAKKVKCPLCEGQGELAEQQLHDRLAEKDLGRKLATYIDDVVHADVTEASRANDFDRQVDSWNCTHFLWRRSPKE
jgi:hypothetical protein